MQRLDTIASLKYFTPEIVVVFTMMAVLLLDLIAMKRSRGERRMLIVAPALIGLGVALFYSIRLAGSPPRVSSAAWWRRTVSGASCGSCSC